MPGLTTRLRRMPRDDRGAVTTLVAALVGVGMLLGIGALVVDTGQLYAERAELQNGADAAAFALAQDCGDSDGCGPEASGTAKMYAGANAYDGAAAANLVCGRDAAGVLAACPAPGPGASPCLGARPAAGNFVEVRTSTQLKDGSTVLPPAFGRMLLGDSYQGRGVLACSQVAWGGLRAAYGMGLTMSLCEWEAATSNGTVYAPAPPNAVSASDERVLRIHGTGNACAGGPSGWDLPGGFGWLEDHTGKCETQVDIITGIYRDTSGVAASQACKDALAKAVTKNEIVLVPVYDGAGGTGHTGYYHLRGFASFVITGYNLPGYSALSTVSGRRLCLGDDKCIYGYFTRDLVSVNAVVGGPSMGATAVQVIG